jgi:hypothetical protein
VAQRAPCRFDLGPASQSVSAGGGAGSVNVSVLSECAWTATTDVSWISLTPPLTGNGNGTVAFTVAPNGGDQRTGSVIIGGQRSVVTQAAPVASPCDYRIAPTSQNIGATGGAGTVAVSAQGGCAWTASSTAAWITVTAGSTGRGNGSVAFSVAANTGASRTGTLTIAGETFTVTQAAAPPCSYSISPDKQKVDATPGTGTVAVSTASHCTWTATSNATWITITSGASGTGNGTVTFRVGNNNGEKRKGTLTVAGRTAEVEQDDR